jgi:Cu(I)/Ag(I) efflux system membrane protein CusA/SilA
VYIDQAYERRLRAGLIRGAADVVAAHLEGTIARVRPKVMTVAAMTFGLVPLLWADSSGADVMKRIAAPMVGGLISSAFLTLELIPVVYTYWRCEQLLWQKLAHAAPSPLQRMRGVAISVGAFLALAALAAVAPVYLRLPYMGWAAVAALVTASLLAVRYTRIRRLTNFGSDHLNN